MDVATPQLWAKQFSALTSGWWRFSDRICARASTTWTFEWDGLGDETISTRPIVDRINAARKARADRPSRAQSVAGPFFCFPRHPEPGWKVLRKNQFLIFADQGKAWFIIAETPARGRSSCRIAPWNRGSQRKITDTFALRDEALEDGKQLFAAVRMAKPSGADPIYGFGILTRG